MNDRLENAMEFIDYVSYHYASKDMIEKLKENLSSIEGDVVYVNDWCFGPYLSSNVANNEYCDSCGESNWTTIQIDRELAVQVADKYANLFKEIEELCG